MHRLALPTLSSLLAAVASVAQVPQQPEVDRLQQRVLTLEKQVGVLLQQAAGEGRPPEQAEAPGGWSDRLVIGGYGESHANFVQQSDNDFLDNHRFVLYLGYAFADWIQLDSEVELEHSFVEEDNGEISLEQLHVDFLLRDEFNVRVGRSLVPIGIVNRIHEPPTFFGVERPFVDQAVIPTTWSQDGIGVFGKLGEHLGYELYVGSGLDGSGFSTEEGIREGRLEERPGLSEPGVTGRIDVRPLAGDSPHDLRLGASFFTSGLGNGNQSPSNAPGRLQMYSADAQWRYGDFEARGVYAVGLVDDAAKLSTFVGETIGNRIQGFYLEGAWHWLPDSWRAGKLADADAAVFVRYEDFDTQAHVPAGLVPDGNADRQAWTIGMSFYPVPNLVLKADYQFIDDDAGNAPDRWNLGIGWMF